MVQCCAYDCTNRGSHKFPADKTLRRKWDFAVSRKNFKSTPSSRLCAVHFKPEDFTELTFYGDKPCRKRLKQGAIPSLFSWKLRKVSHQRELNRRVQRQLFNRPSEAPPCNDEVHEVHDHLDEVHHNDGVCEVVSMDIDRESDEVQYICETGPFSVVEETVGDQDNAGGYVCDEESSEEAIGPDVNLVWETEQKQPQRQCAIYSAKYFEGNNEGIQFYTGLESYEKFLFVFSTLQPEVENLQYLWGPVNILPEDALLLTLMKLRRNTATFELHMFFNISEKVVSNVFVTWVVLLHQLWSKLDVWPVRELVDFYMPEGFKMDYPATRVIIDATEIPIQKPSQPAAQMASWSNYKNRNTVKFEVGVSPAGLISHISAAYGGSASDRQITERSGFTNKCEKGDSIMADRGYTVQDIFASKGVTINMPHFVKGKSQLPRATLLQDRKLSSKRVHVERLIGLIKTYNILCTPLHHSYVPLASKIFFVCAMLCNFREGIVSNTA